MPEVTEEVRKLFHGLNNDISVIRSVFEIVTIKNKDPELTKFLTEGKKRFKTHQDKINKIRSLFNG